MSLPFPSALDAVEEVHTVLEPARHRPGVAGRQEQAKRTEYAPHGIPTREGERIGVEAEEVAELVSIRAPEKPPAPEGQDDHSGSGSAGRSPDSGGTCASA